MIYQPVTLSEADDLAVAALSRATELNCNPLTIAVLDQGGHLVVLKRQDGSGILRPDIAIGKAWGALGMGMSSRVLAERAESKAQFFASLAAVSGGRLVPAPGGVLIYRGGCIVGAVGVSGDSSDRDEECALAGIESVGLDAE